MSLQECATQDTIDQFGSIWSIWCLMILFSSNMSAGKSEQRRQHAQGAWGPRLLLSIYTSVLSVPFTRNKVHCSRCVQDSHVAETTRCVGGVRPKEEGGRTGLRHSICFLCSFANVADFSMAMILWKTRHSTVLLVLDWCNLHPFIQNHAGKYWESLEWIASCEEMERKRDLIRQIRALEKVPVEKYKQLGSGWQRSAVHGCAAIEHRSSLFALLQISVFCHSYVSYIQHDVCGCVCVFIY